MRSLLVHGVLQAAIVLACVGCASVSAPRLHTLMPTERPAPREGAPGPGLGPILLIEPVRVPAQVDQQQWLVRLPDDTFALLEQERWAGPLRDEIQQALQEVLTQRYGAVDVRVAPPAAPSWRIRVDVTRFESRPGEARLDSTWLIVSGAGDSAALRCRSELREAAGAGMPALAEAHRRAVARLADAIGDQLLALRSGRPGRCVA